MVGGMMDRWRLKWAAFSSMRKIAIIPALMENLPSLSCWTPTGRRFRSKGIPLPAPVTVNHAGLEKTALAVIGGCHPTDQRHQQDALLIMGHPEPQSVLLIPDKEPALAAFERPAPQRGAIRRVLSGSLFLCPEQAASKSVASIRATTMVHLMPPAKP